MSDESNKHADRNAALAAAGLIGAAVGGNVIYAKYKQWKRKKRKQQQFA